MNRLLLRAAIVSRRWRRRYTPLFVHGRLPTWRFGWGRRRDGGPDIRWRGRVYVHPVMRGVPDNVLCRPILICHFVFLLKKFNPIYIRVIY